MQVYEARRVRRVGERVVAGVDDAALPQVAVDIGRRHRPDGSEGEAHHDPDYNDEPYCARRGRVSQSPRHDRRHAEHRERR